MTKEAAEFYSRGAEKFAERHKLEETGGKYHRLLEEFVEKVGEGRVLDAGCGPGRDVRYFIDDGLEAEGVDLSEEMIKEAEKRGKGSFTVMDVRDLEFPESSFDGVWCNTVLIFMPPREMEETVKEFTRVMKEGGVLHLGLKEGEGTFKREKYGSSITQYLLPEEKARELLRDAGLEVEEVYLTDTDEEFKFMNIFARLPGGSDD